MRAEGMSDEPDLDDPSQAIVHRVMLCLQAEFADDAQVPRIVVVAECPPVGRIGVASTGDDEIDTHRMLSLGAATVRQGMSAATKQKARQLWLLMRAGFENRQ